MATAGVNMQMTSDRGGLALIWPTDEGIEALLAAPSCTQELQALYKTALEVIDPNWANAGSLARDRRTARRRLCTQIEIPAGAEVTYVAHLGASSIRVILADGREAEMNLRCFAQLR